MPPVDNMHIHTVVSLGLTPVLNSNLPDEGSVFLQNVDIPFASLHDVIAQRTTL